MAISLTITVSGFKAAMDSQRLSTAASQLQADLVYAAQTSLRDNVVVYLQFIKEADPTMPGDTESWSSYQLGTLVNPDAEQLYPFGEKRKLPQGVVIAPSPVFSTALFETSGDEAVLNTKKRVSIGFRPDGLTTLPRNGTKDLCLTLINEIESERSTMGKVPSSSRIILINPHTSAVSVY